ncbi:MAG: hypothetical protein KC731_36090, partial [Myxococcales bacterium]|nr:hypothetical protein [Myxococcales bacterium]
MGDASSAYELAEASRWHPHGCERVALRHQLRADCCLRLVVALLVGFGIVHGVWGDGRDSLRGCPAVAVFGSGGVLNALDGWLAGLKAALTKLVVDPNLHPSPKGQPEESLHHRPRVGGCGLGDSRDQVLRDSWCMTVHAPIKLQPVTDR